METKQIMLVCAAGMSTSLMVNKMQKAAEERGLAATIFAVRAVRGNRFPARGRGDRPENLVVRGDVVSFPFQIHVSVLGSIGDGEHRHPGLLRTARASSGFRTRGIPAITQHHNHGRGGEIGKFSRL